MTAASRIGAGVNYGGVKMHKYPFNLEAAKAGAPFASDDFGELRFVGDFKNHKHYIGMDKSGAGELILIYKENTRCYMLGPDLPSEEWKDNTGVKPDEEADAVLLRNRGTLLFPYKREPTYRWNFAGSEYDIMAYLPKKKEQDKVVSYEEVQEKNKTFNSGRIAALQSLIKYCQNEIEQWGGD